MVVITVQRKGETVNPALGVDVEVVAVFNIELREVGSQVQIAVA